MRPAPLMALHTREVQGSIPCAPTIFVNEIKYILDRHATALVADWHLYAGQNTKWRAVARKIRAVRSLGVLMQISVLAPGQHPDIGLNLPVVQFA